VFENGASGFRGSFYKPLEARVALANPEMPKKEIGSAFIKGLGLV
jgi:hypothetical protein